MRGTPKTDAHSKGMNVKSLQSPFTVTVTTINSECKDFTFTVLQKRQKYFEMYLLMTCIFFIPHQARKLRKM